MSMSVQFSYFIRRSGHQLIRSMNPNAANAKSYEHWTREELIARLLDLDDRTRTSNAKATTQRAAPTKVFDFAAHPVRKIALKFCYSGWEYNGLAFQKTPTPLPTVEEVLFQALAKTRLIDPDAGYDGCGWERCGRTDRGVSAAGQVISLWVRTAAEGDKGKGIAEGPKDDVRLEHDSELSNFPEGALADPSEAKSVQITIASEIPVSSKVAKRRKTEFNYIQLLNRILPPTIRVIAWAPVEPSFSARFNCQQRHYKYFFCSEGLDISLMRDGAQRMIGENDFRNLCKIDPTKQITNFHRRILRAEISAVPDTKDTYVFDLVGTAFLYHQVRHIMAILFLIGTGLEHPSVISSLLNVTPDKAGTLPSTKEDDPPLEVVDRKPDYQMADGLPLMLWDCSFSEKDVQWRTTPENVEQDNSRGTGAELYDQLHSIHARSTIHTTLDAHFLAAAAPFHPRGSVVFPRNQSQVVLPPVIQIPLGGGTTNRNGNFKPLLQRKRLESAEVVNERWLSTGQGLRQQEKRRRYAEGDCERAGGEE